MYRLLWLIPLAQMVYPADFTANFLNEKALAQALARLPALEKGRPPVQDRIVCAIPLKEVKATSAHAIEPLARSRGTMTRDEIARPAPILACPKR